MAKRVAVMFQWPRLRVRREKRSRVRVPFIITVCVATFALLGATIASSEPRWAELNREARQAITANDYPKLSATLRELAPLMPGNVRVAYNMAAAAAKLSDSPAALAGLDRLCRMGLVFDLDADADFDALRDSAQYDAARKCMAHNRQPVTHARQWRVLNENDLLPEDIAYDPTSRRVFVSSIRKNRIIDSEGRLFAGTDWPVLALAVDDKRRTLWATIGWLPHCDACAASDEGKSALIAFDLDSGSNDATRRITSPRTARRHDDRPA